MLKEFSLISFPVNFQVFNTPSKRKIMDRYKAANSLFVSQILLELYTVKYGGPELHS